MAVLIRDNQNEMISNYHLNFTIMCIIGTLIHGHGGLEEGCF